MDSTFTNETHARTLKYLAHTYDPAAVSIEAYDGDVWLISSGGKRYLDMNALYSSVGFGHKGSARFWAAATEQQKSIGMVPGFLCNPVRAKCVKELAEFTYMDKVLFKVDGAGAFDAAVKIARRWAYNQGRGGGEIIVCQNNFHGRTLGAISASSTKQYRKGFGPLLPGFKLIKFGDTDALEEAITDETIAFLIEPIEAEGGIHVPPDYYLSQAKEICRKNKMLFIFDEVQTGFGRTGYRFAWQHDSARPDMMMLGKMLGGGVYPVSAVVGTDEVMSVLEPGDDGSTFGGSPIACAVVLEVIEAFWEKIGLLTHVVESGNYFMHGLRKIFETIKFPPFVEVRGRGLLVGIEFNSGIAPLFKEKLLEKGVICSTAHDNVVRFSPPLVINRTDLDFALMQVEAVVREIANEMPQ